MGNVKQTGTLIRKNAAEHRCRERRESQFIQRTHEKMMHSLILKSGEGKRRRGERGRRRITTHGVKKTKELKRIRDCNYILKELWLCIPTQVSDWNYLWQKPGLKILCSFTFQTACCLPASGSSRETSGKPAPHKASARGHSRRARQESW